MVNNVKWQYIATFSVNLLTISYGIVIAWASPTIPLLLSNESPLSSTYGPINETESSWIVSITCIGGAISSIPYGRLVERIGRKKCLILCGIQQMISWLIIAIGTTPIHLYISRFLAGISGGGVFILVPIFISEISDDRIRGTLGASLILSSNFGIIIGYIIGGYLNYYVVPLIGIGIIVIFLIGMLYLPETPQYLLNCNRFEDAENSIRFYRGFRHKKINASVLSYRNDDDEEVKLKSAPVEMEIVKSNQPDTFLVHRETVIQMQKNTNKSQSITFNDFKDQSTRKGIIIGTVLIMMTQFNGSFVILNYTSIIFKNAGSTLEPNVCAIIVGIIQLIGSYFSVLLVDKIGRKTLLVLSALGNGLGLLAMAIYSYLQYKNYDTSQINWIPLLSLSVIVFFACLGVIPISFVVTVEVLPQKLKSLVMSTLMVITLIIAFLIIRYFNDIIAVFQMHGCMAIFTVFCFLDTVFVIFVIPETKGKTSDEIVALLKGGS